MRRVLSSTPFVLFSLQLSPCSPAYQPVDGVRPMLFAEATVQDLWSAVIVAAIAIIGALSGLILLGIAYLKKKLEKKIEDTDTTYVTQDVAHKVNAVYRQVNGDGLTGSVRRVEAGVRRIEAEQKAHNESDRQQFEAMRKYMGMPE